MEEQERIVKGIWIPIEIWKDKNLTWNEKILFLEIDSYTSKEKDCYFSNEYISELLGISITNASKTISSLIEKGYIIKTKFDGRKRYVKSALSYSTSLPNQTQQPSHAHVNNILIDSISKDINNKTNKEKELKEKSDSLFEKCWKAYRRKGSKKKSLEYWNKLNLQEQQSVMPHIKAYVDSRDMQYQKDFERYLRDKIFLSVVFKNNSIIYDPVRFESVAYTPQGRSIWFDENTKSYWTDDNFYYGVISDGYTDEDRPDGATLTMSNARGTIVWNKNNKKWLKQ